MKASPVSYERNDVAPQEVTTLREIHLIVDNELLGDKRVTAFVDREVEEPSLPADVISPVEQTTKPEEKNNSEFEYVWSQTSQEEGERFAFPAFITSANIVTSEPEISAALEVKRPKLPLRKRLAVALGALAAFGVGMTSTTTPASAETIAYHATDDKPNQPILGKMSANKAYETCKEDVLVVAHTAAAGEGVRTKFDVNTVKWIEHSIREGHERLELDLQPSKDGVGEGLHNRTLNAETNGSGPVHGKDSAVIARLRTPHGEHVSTQEDYIRILKDNPKISFQMEWKDYDNQWTGDRIDAVIAKFAEAGVLGQLHFSSASTRVIRYLHDKYPEVGELQLIGFGNYLPNLHVAKKIGASQVNVTSEAALRNNAQYMKQAKKMGIRVSVRSKPSGEGDNGKIWFNTIKNGADQIVTQGATKYFVCQAVRKAAKAS
jgi:glycerophosphoryl diester phosphodiesterase